MLINSTSPAWHASTSGSAADSSSVSHSEAVRFSFPGRFFSCARSDSIMTIALELEKGVVAYLCLR